MGLLFTSVKNETIHKGVEKIFIEEKRAPTDDSIRIYKEMEEKIHSQIAEKLFVKNNLINYSIAFCNSPVYLHPIMYVKIKINDEEFSESFNITHIYDPENLVEILINWLSKKMLMLPIHNIFEAFYSKQLSNYKVIDPIFEKERNDNAKI